MPYCQSCGNEVGKEVSFCPLCGANITIIEQSKQYPIIQEQELPQLVQRNYLIWFLLSALTSGVFGLIYFYFVFEDLNKLDKYPRPKNVPTTAVDTNKLVTYFIVLYLLSPIFPPLALIIMYMLYKTKYSKLNDYLEKHPIKQNNYPAPTKRILGLIITQQIMAFISIPLFFLVGFAPVIWFDPSLLMILVIVLIFVVCITFGAVIIISIFVIIYDYKWQEALNERIKIIDPRAPMKELI